MRRRYAYSSYIEYNLWTYGTWALGKIIKGNFNLQKACALLKVLLEERRQIRTLDLRWSVNCIFFSWTVMIYSSSVIDDSMVAVMLEAHLTRHGKKLLVCLLERDSYP